MVAVAAEGMLSLNICAGYYWCLLIALWWLFPASCGGYSLLYSCGGYSLLAVVVIPC